MNFNTGKCYICGKTAEEVRKVFIEKTTEVLHLNDYNFDKDEFVQEEYLKIKQIDADRF